MNDLFDHIWKHKLVFFGTFFVVFTLSYLLLSALDFLPEPPTTEEVRSEQENEEVVASDPVVSDQVEVEPVVSVAEAAAVEPIVAAAAPITLGSEEALPTSIVIKKLGKTVPVLNPTSRVIADLDAALLRGVVRHPDSATLAQDGNIFILGHSSYLPQVFNKNFQAFNGIQNLEWGDKIELYTSVAAYEYRVEKVYRAQAQDLTVPIAGTGKMLTLATCNSFGSVDDRYIVEATLIAERAL